MTNRFSPFANLPVWAVLLTWALWGGSVHSARAQSPGAAPDKVVVLTFDDSVKSHFTVVRPILKKYGFQATFFITEGFDFADNKTDYMTWEEIAKLHQDGFEIGNHTRDHLAVTAKNLEKLEEQVLAIANRCREHGIPQPVSFAYPGNRFVLEALPILKKLGIQFARRGGAPEYDYKTGGGSAYEPGFDHPLLIPTAGDARPDWSLDDFIKAVSMAELGRIAVLQFHGVPDRAHPWVHTAPEQFEAYMKYLAVNEYHVIAVRDLHKYIDAARPPRDPMGVIKDRQQAIAKHRGRENFRRPANEKELRYWLENMVWRHGFSRAEIRQATGLSREEVGAALKRWNIRRETRPPRDENAPLLVLPYPGGRHPRIGFLEGAIRPQRETKFSVFPPWSRGEYFVVDVPEAIWVVIENERNLLYLAHTHIPTLWGKQGVSLEPLEWRRGAAGRLSIERVLPNKVAFGAKISPAQDAVHMEMWLKNGSSHTLSGMRVQNCVMLKAAPEFAVATNENKILQPPYAACKSADGRRWVITAWTNCQRAWGNPPCPCLHSDPQFPDCPPGETRRLRGWLSFYEGDDIAAELRRIDATGWRNESDR